MPLFSSPTSVKSAVHGAQSVIAASLNATDAAFFTIAGAFHIESSVDSGVHRRFERHRRGKKRHRALPVGRQAGRMAARPRVATRQVRSRHCTCAGPAGWVERSDTHRSFCPKRQSLKSIPLSRPYADVVASRVMGVATLDHPTNLGWLAAMVALPGDYRWSSHQSNVLGPEDSRLTMHTLWKHRRPHPS